MMAEQSFGVPIIPSVIYSPRRSVDIGLTRTVTDRKVRDTVAQIVARPLFSDVEAVMSRAAMIRLLDELSGGDFINSPMTIMSLVHENVMDVVKRDIQRSMIRK